jgi:hypothetical protein
MLLRKGGPEEVLIHTHETRAQQSLRIIHTKVAIIAICDNCAQSTNRNLQVAKHILRHRIWPAIDGKAQLIITRAFRLR